ncbi:hypothetical protein SAMN04487830_11546 [Pseudobutyrivibrio sp. OR37]|uniref:hypothetical protein n=1 Tax=Pseudobutyrivibrio sp. OR37 TaxID=1798186 RepID=UPI0008E856DC|nr:hypothetical protein [Pseudobutyrivibrio sp. OR37]SFH97901.1 hypothetical protein SAMN04487830_11546 [Pseudobutyrivibrio sp. OR37]
MKYKKYLLVATAAILVATASIKPAMAYFTDSQTATGARTIKLGDSKLTPPEDTVSNMIKTVKISNTGDYEVFVRVKAIAPEGVKVELSDDSSSKWKLVGDYYYYLSSDTEDVENNGQVLSVDETTEPLKLKIEEPTAEKLKGQNFNVVIVQEATKVLYHSNGKTFADWKLKINGEVAE